MVIGTLAIAAVAMAYILTRTPEMRTLFPGLAEADKAAVVEALQAAGITPGMDSMTGSVQVPASDYHKARMLLAGQGLRKLPQRVMRCSTTCRSGPAAQSSRPA